VPRGSSSGAASFRRFSVSVAGVSSPVLSSGPEDQSEAVVFVHGNPGAAREWSDLMSRAGGFARCVAIDMPGFGGADKPRDFDCTAEGYARHLEGVLEQLDIRRAHLVVHDFGGPWALQWAVEHPESFVSATMINSGIWVDYSRYHLYGRIWSTPVLGELFMATSTRAGTTFMLGRENPGLSKAQVNQLYEQAHPWATRRSILRLYRANPPRSLASRSEPMRAIDPAALVVWGAADAYIPRDMAERQRRSFPSARIEYLEDLGHWCFLEDPERVAALVIPFLREQLNPAHGPSL
jgi:pimeloyl-ACP methyl ester carboxylesterase